MCTLDITHLIQSVSLLSRGEPPNRDTFQVHVCVEILNMYQQMVLWSLLMFSRSLLTSDDEEKTSCFSRSSGTRSRQVNTLVEFVVVVEHRGKPSSKFFIAI